MKESEGRFSAMEQRCADAEAGRVAAEDNLQRITKQLAAIQGMLGLSLGVAAA